MSSPEPAESSERDIERSAGPDRRLRRKTERRPNPHMKRGIGLRSVWSYFCLTVAAESAVLAPDQRQRPTCQAILTRQTSQLKRQANQLKKQSDPVELTVRATEEADRPTEEAARLTGGTNQWREL